MEEFNGKLLIVIDMQNDFITGSLANPDAEAIVKPLCDYIKTFDGDIICTRDTHYENYLETPEGKKLPVKHCIEGTPGWCIATDIQDAIRSRGWLYQIPTVDKNTFGYIDWNNTGLDIKDEISEITLVGTCTDICVVSNALILKALYPNKNIIVKASLCAGLTKEKHEAALEVMRSCQIDVIE